MNFNFHFPVNIISGEGAVLSNADRFRLGKRAFIVCGRQGAEKSGALADTVSVLSSLGIEYSLFNRITANPKLDDCFEGGRLCREYRADFVIGIGGGSALDAAKAVAIFAVNNWLEAEEIFNSCHGQLPMIAIPTTSGTGSEANGTSVMSMPDGLRKLSFKCDCPTVSFLDPRYTYSLPYSTTVSTALDAFAHSFESYLSPKSTPASRLFAVYAAGEIWRILSTEPSEFSSADRLSLQNAACAAGLAISVTGTGFPHPLGYSLSMLDGIPHGAACAVFYGEYIAYNLKTELGNTLIHDFCSQIGAEPSVLAVEIPRLSGVRLTLDDAAIRSHISLVTGAKNYTNSPYVLSDDEKYAIYRKLFAN